jgi:hypothetical protein
LTNIIQLTLENTTAKVKVNNTFTTDFKIDTGVKQGDPLSPTLFNLVIDTVLTQLDLRGNISTCLKQLIAYADDMLPNFPIDNACVIYTKTFRKQKKDDARYAMKIEKIPYHLRTGTQFKAVYIVKIN